MKRLVVLTALILAAFSANAQEIKIDTVWVRTEATPWELYQFYVINGQTEIRIHFMKDEPSKKDTVYYETIIPEDVSNYSRELNILKLKAKPIEKVDADEVFDYFKDITSLEDVIKKLGNKKVYVQKDYIEVAFYRSLSKKNEVFRFNFRDGELVSISRPSTNTLPTNDVWTAFQLLKMRDDLDDLSKLLKSMNGTK